jgi:hypothetical protein
MLRAATLTKRYDLPSAPSSAGIRGGSATAFSAGSGAGTRSAQQQQSVTVIVMMLMAAAPLTKRDMTYHQHRQRPAAGEGAPRRQQSQWAQGPAPGLHSNSSQSLKMLRAATLTKRYDIPSSPALSSAGIRGGFSAGSGAGTRSAQQQQSVTVTVIVMAAAAPLTKRDMTYHQHQRPAAGEGVPRRQQSQWAQGPAPGLHSSHSHCDDADGSRTI